MRLSFSLLFLFTISAHAKVEVLFHPHSPTFEKIAQWITEAQSQIDIAMYSMDTNDKSPIVLALKSPAVQARIASGQLKVRMIYEGYGKPEQNQKRMAEAEAMGIDVRFLGKSIDMHHKFAVIDHGRSLERVTTGSANWSMSSFRNYNENILYFENEPGAATRFQTEFERLWLRCREFGHSQAPVQNSVADPVSIAELDSQLENLKIYFNSPRRLKIPDVDGDILTDKLVQAIDKANSHIEIASTRVRLIPVLEAIKRAANRGVNIRILLGQDDYRDLEKRKAWLIDQPNILLRVKFYSLKIGAYMGLQMHNKMMIVDGNTLLTGSFNWSKSGQTQHIENLVELDGALAQMVLPAYISEFESLWEMGRAEFPNYLAELEKYRARNERPPCGFKPTALTYDEVHKLLLENPECGKKPTSGQQFLAGISRAV